MTSTAIPTVGSVLQIMPATGGAVSFTSDSERWSLPLLGYAVVVRWVSEDGDVRHDVATYETEVQPLMIDTADSGMPTTMHEYQAGRARYVPWSVEPA